MTNEVERNTIAKQASKQASKQANKQASKQSKQASKQANKQASKQASISYLRIFATMCVVVLHTCSTLWRKFKGFLLKSQATDFFLTHHIRLCIGACLFFL